MQTAQALIPLFLLITDINPNIGKMIDRPFWVLGSDKPQVGEISDAWLILPANISGSSELVQAEIMTPIGLKAWIRRESETCQAAYIRNSRTWSGSNTADVIVPVCLRASHSQTLRLIARVSSPAMALRNNERVAIAEPLEAQERFRFGDLSIAIASAILGFLTGAISRLLDKRSELRTARRKAEAEVESVVAREVVGEILGNYHRLQNLLQHPSTSENLHTKGSDLLFDESSGLFAYLRKPHQLGYIRKIKTIYGLFNEYNQAINRGASGEARDAARRILSLLDRSIYDFVEVPRVEGGVP